MVIILVASHVELYSVVYANINYSICLCCFNIITKELKIDTLLNYVNKRELQLYINTCLF